MAALEPWPSLKDPEFIHFMQQYPSQLCKRTHMVLRKFAHGFIACKFSALAYLIIGILWLDHEKKPEEKIAMMKKMDIRRMGAFQNQQLESIFMRNQRVEPSKEINSFDDIVFEYNIALFGIVDGGQIYHYFLLVKLPDGYSIYSSYGSDSISIYQYETKVTPIFFENFAKSLKKEKKTPTDQKRIRGFMRAHFLNPVFQLVQRKPDEYVKETGSKMKNTPKDIRDEIEKYVVTVSTVIQFQSILPAIQEELSHYESIKEPEAEKAEAEKAEAEKAEAEEPEKAEEAKAEVAIELKAAEDEAEQDAQAEEAEETKRIAEETKGGRKTRRSKYKRRKYDTYRKRRI